MIQDLPFNYAQVTKATDFKDVPLSYAKLIKFIGHENCNLYLPVVLNDELICEGIRRWKNQHIRLDLFPDIVNESILDVGTNTGYLLFELKKMGTDKCKCIGIDNDRNNLQIAQGIVEFERLKNINFYEIDFNKVDVNASPKYDNVLFLSIVSYDNILEELSKLLKIANKRLIIEPSNTKGHYEGERKTKDEIQEWVETELREKVVECGSDAKIKLLGFTDYQNRGLIEILK